MNCLEIMIAFRYLRAKRKEGFISVNAGFSLLGIALGVATLIVVMAVMNGFRIELMDRILGINGHVVVSSFEGKMPNDESVPKELLAMEGVNHVTPMIEGQAMAMSRGISAGALVKGIEKEHLLSRPLFSQSLIQGNIDDFVGKSAVILGVQLAQNLQVRVGDSITLIAPQTTTTVLGTLPRIKEYLVVGLASFGMYEYDSSIIFMPLEAAQVYFKLPDSVTAFELLIDNPYEVSDLTESLLLKYRGKYRIADWEMNNAHFFNALKVERVVMFFILALIILVAAFNIISSLIMLVNDKSRQIAILRTMGLSRSAILRIFFMCGASIGIIGTVLGVALGVSFALNIETIRRWLEALIGNQLFDPVIYFLSELPAELEADNVILVTLMSLGLSFLATIYPAWKAAKQDPAEVLRYE